MLSVTSRMLRSALLSRLKYIRLIFRVFQGKYTASIHKIPNLRLGKWAGANRIQILFLDLYDPECRNNPQLSIAEQEAFYEDGLRPAILDLMKVEWSSIRACVAFRDSHRSGSQESITKEVDEHVAGSLVQRIRRHLAVNNSFIGSNIKVVHEVRGAKNNSMHDFNRSEATAGYAFRLWLRSLSLPLFIANSKTWYVDVGMEVKSYKKASLVWRTEAHSALLQHLCEVSTLRAERMTTPGSSCYRRDMNSQLIHLSGCVIYPGDDGGPHSIVKIQLYDTAQSLVYLPDDQKYFSTQDILSGKYKLCLDGMLDEYQHASNNSHISARLKVRVPARYAAYVLHDMDEDLIRGSLCAFDTKIWW